MKLSTCTEWLFFHLWKRNPETKQSCPGVIIPETIIYRSKYLLKMGSTLFLVFHEQRWLNS
jgi:hypothetical protein